MHKYEVCLVSEHSVFKAVGYRNKGTAALAQSIFDNVQVIVRKSVVLAFLCVSAYSVWQGAKHADFTKDVLPVLRRHCFECHGPQVQEGDLRFDDRNEFFAGSYSGPAMVAGKLVVAHNLAQSMVQRMSCDSQLSRTLFTYMNSMPQYFSFLVLTTQNSRCVIRVATIDITDVHGEVVQDILM